MEKISVRDRQFKVSIPRDEIGRRVAAVGERINHDLAGKRPLFLAVLNGSFVFAADLMRQITEPCEITFVKMASYEGTSSTGKINQLIGLNTSLKGRHVVIVEDIIDSGRTMKHLLEILRDAEAADVKIASLLVKPGNLEVKLDIDYCCFEIPNDFIVGYGLDYDGEGRNLPDIYTVTD